MPSSDVPDPRFLGGAEGMVLSDARDFALVVLVDHKGVADASANGIEHKQAAEWLRHIADLWDPPTPTIDQGATQP